MMPTMQNEAAAKIDDLLTLTPATQAQSRTDLACFENMLLNQDLPIAAELQRGGIENGQ